MKTRETTLTWAPIPANVDLLPDEGALFLVVDEYDTVYAAVVEDGELVIYDDSDDDIEPLYYAEIEAPDFS